MFVSEQAARLHNALGVVIKDMFKALSDMCKQPIEPQQCLSDDEETHRVSLRINPARRLSGVPPSSMSPVIMEIPEDDDWTNKQQLNQRVSEPVKQAIKPRSPRKRCSVLNEIEIQDANSRPSAEQPYRASASTAGTNKRRPSTTSGVGSVEQTYRVSCNMCKRFYESIGGDYD